MDNEVRTKFYIKGDDDPSIPDTGMITKIADNSIAVLAVIAPIVVAFIVAGAHIKKTKKCHMRFDK